MFTRGQFATIAAATVTTLLLEINKAMPTPYMVRSVEGGRRIHGGSHALHSACEQPPCDNP